MFCFYGSPSGKETSLLPWSFSLSFFYFVDDCTQAFTYLFVYELARYAAFVGLMSAYGLLGVIKYRKTGDARVITLYSP